MLQNADIFLLLKKNFVFKLKIYTVSKVTPIDFDELSNNVGSFAFLPVWGQTMMSVN